MAKGEVPELLVVQNKNKTAVGRHADQTTTKDSHQTESPLKPQDAFLTHAGVRGHHRFGSTWTDRALYSRFTEREMHRSPSWFTDAPRGRCVCNLFVKGNKSAVVLRSRSISYICFSSQNKTSGHQKHTRMVSGRGKYCDSHGLPRKQHRLNC